MAEQKKRKRDCHDNDGSEADHEELFECQWSLCDKVYTEKTNRSRHEKNCKKGVFPPKVSNFTCENQWCLKVFDRKSNYNRHVLTCKPKASHVHVCMECDKTFDRLSKLERHQKTHEKETFSCFECNAVYQRLDKLQIHQKKCGTTLTVVANPPVHLERASMLDLFSANTESASVDSQQYPGATTSFDALSSSTASQVQSVVEPSISLSADLDADSDTPSFVSSAADSDAPSFLPCPLSDVHSTPDYSSIDFEAHTIPTENPDSSFANNAVQDEFPVVYILDDSCNKFDENYFIKDSPVFLIEGSKY